MIVLLPNNKIELDSKDYYESTPLLIAVRHGHIEVVNGRHQATTGVLEDIHEE